MKRLAVFVTIVMMTAPTSAWAEGTLLQSAVRAAERLARTSSSAPGRTARADQPAQQAPGLQASGMSKRTKIMITIGAAAAFAAVALSIDRGVVNNTPSTLGTRKD
jgi:hypothetical protein